MATKARLMVNIIGKALFTSKNSNNIDGKYKNHDDNSELFIYNRNIDVNEDDNSMYYQYKSFKKILIYDINEKKFEDIYSQTIFFIKYIHK